VLVTGFPAEAFGTNCYVVATGPGEQCLVVDPGIGVLDRLDEVLEPVKEHDRHEALQRRPMPLRVQAVDYARRRGAGKRENPGIGMRHSTSHSVGGNRMALECRPSGGPSRRVRGLRPAGPVTAAGCPDGP